VTTVPDLHPDEATLLLVTLEEVATAPGLALSPAKLLTTTTTGDRALHLLRIQATTLVDRLLQSTPTAALLAPLVTLLPINPTAVTHHPAATAKTMTCSRTAMHLPRVLQPAATAPMTVLLLRALHVATAQALPPVQDPCPLTIALALEVEAVPHLVLEASPLHLETLSLLPVELAAAVSHTVLPLHPALHPTKAIPTVHRQDPVAQASVAATSAAEATTAIAAVEVEAPNSPSAATTPLRRPILALNASTILNPTTSLPPTRSLQAGNCFLQV
jgi:hypothetical protein